VSLYFWSDTHFNHRGILEHCAATRPFASVEDMNESMISRWSATVGPRDTIHLLGDFGFRVRGLPELSEIFGRLNGQKHLVVGNHDEKNPELLKLGWLSVRHLGVVRQDGRKVVVCHYPLETWASAHHGVIHAHGHSHGTLRRKIPHRFDVGADVYPSPVAWDALWLASEAQAYDPQDHHGADL
jgi:calcineurin-like phosphoesterase family protein